MQRTKQLKIIHIAIAYMQFVKLIGGQYSKPQILLKTPHAPIYAPLSRLTPITIPTKEIRQSLYIYLFHSRDGVLRRHGIYGLAPVKFEILS
jgi:hypothetical protein